jgi:hypothetical protein
LWVPIGRGVAPLLWSVCFNVSGLGSRPRPRWRSARPDPHNQSGLQSERPPSGPFKGVRFSSRRSTVGPSSFYLTQTSVTRRREWTPRAILALCGHRFVAGVVDTTTRQGHPGNARQLVGQRNNDNILVRPRQQSARPPAKRRLLLIRVRQHGARAMDQVLANESCSSNLRRPCGATIPRSSRNARKGLISAVRSDTSRSRARCAPECPIEPGS